MAALFDSLQRIFQTGHQTSYEKGETVLRSGDLQDVVYMLVDGIAISYTYNGKGNKNIHTMYGIGDIFPVAAFTHSKTVPAYFEALTPISLRKLAPKEFTDKVKDDAESSYDLAMQITNQYAHFVQRIGTLQYTNAYDRVVYHLLVMTGRFGQRLPNGSVQLTIPLTHSFIASTVNIARETASRCLKRLVNKQLISSEYKYFVILSVAGLSAELHDSTIDVDNWLA